MSKPIYKVGDILTLEQFDGRSTYYIFLQVASLTKSGTPRVYILQRENVSHACHFGTSAKTEVRPIFAASNSKPQTMRWYPSIGQYAFERPYSCSYTKLRPYDPEATYIEEWLSS
jgi:hypothetical protein